MSGLRLLFLLLLVFPATGYTVGWKEILQQPAEWYGSPEAEQIVKTVIAHQTTSGGWPKNRDFTVPPAVSMPKGPGENTDVTWATIDNGATVRPMRFLARVIEATENRGARDSWNQGLEYLLAAQYDNGGWPQFYPLRKGYYSRITFNDEAMINVLVLLREVAQGAGAFPFASTGQRSMAAAAVQRGLACILKCQVVVGGVKTAWCAQHDEYTFEPAPARSYELVSLSGMESVAIVRFLMGEPRGDAGISSAIHAAVSWFRETAIGNTRIRRVNTKEFPHGFDVVVEPAPGAPPVWARFYEIGTNRPFFCGRDGVKRYSVAEVEPERRAMYRWYTDAPAELLQEYDAWSAQHAN